MNLDIDKKEVQNLKSLIDFIKRLSNDGITPLIEKQVTLMLGHFLKFFTHLVMTDCFPEIHRLSINKRVVEGNNRIHDIKLLKYPPANCVKSYGRCNMPGESVLYAAFSDMTVLNEIKPRVGDLISRTTWKVKGDETLKYCPIFGNQPQEKDVINPRTFEINQEFDKLIKNYPINLREQIISLTQFVADSFSKKVDSGNHLDYIFSAYFSNKIFNEFENGTIEAIYYPSVQDRLSFENLAIKPTVFDKKYILDEVKESIIIMDPSSGKGGYFMEGISESKSFDFTSGKIIWDKNNIRQPRERIEELKKLYKINLE